jgi:hypothetical protein
MTRDNASLTHQRMIFDGWKRNCESLSDYQDVLNGSWKHRFESWMGQVILRALILTIRIVGPPLKIFHDYLLIVFL